MARWDTSFPEPTTHNGDEDDRPFPSRRDEDEPYPATPTRCDRCGGDAYFGAKSTPQGWFCSWACADAAEADYVAKMGVRRAG